MTHRHHQSWQYRQEDLRVSEFVHEMSQWGTVTVLNSTHAHNKAKRQQKTYIAGI